MSGVLTLDDLKNNYVKKGSQAYIKIIVALFISGFTIFSILYSVQPLIPHFTNAFNVSETVASLALSAATITLAIAMLFFGALSEVLGRKPIMIFSVISVSLLALVQPFILDFNTFLIVRLIQGICLAGLPSIAMAYIGEEISSHNLPEAMGIYISGNAFGGAFGRIFTGFISSIYGYQTGLISIGIISVIAAILFTFLLPASNHFEKQRFSVKALLVSYSKHLKNIRLLKPFMIGFLLLGCNIAAFNYIGFVLADEPYHLHDSVISFVYLLFLIGMISSILNAKLRAQLGTLNALKFSILLIIFGIWITLLPPLPFKILGLAFSVYAFFSGHAIASAVVTSRAEDHKAQASSLYLLFYYMGSSVGGTLAGIFYGAIQWPGVVLMITAFMIIAFIIALTIKQK
ncbi:MFS transporter [Staphylococcus saprophyticus]|uniref:MFS transporter n=1 Tax=Staphylococcus saprophyticus TaxID=29385 RepID=UPI000E68BC81|nr:MFS transporter [Staphylococcus saprophyticus]MDW3862732.1 MFS transporter [Staphylococcus saprophyticus]MDW3914806.1 MFS transporter [Staphylococcus saprophyticus]MDW3925051.1 MFS transporter [Staphylococcus saprophyticus]MDW3961969.1 MFS transporter [Staphylococcus saprophyticus]MDW3965296.1 MFS transporter [Staphylococcus saprophyticus]